MNVVCRNLTKEFEEARASKRRRPTEPVHGARFEGEESSYAVKLQHGKPPLWVDTVEQTQAGLAELKKKITILDNLHRNRLEFHSDADIAAVEKKIDSVTQEIKRLFGQTQAKIVVISSIGNPKGVRLPDAERRSRINVMRKLGSETQDQMRRFRQCQKKYMEELRGADHGDDRLDESVLGAGGNLTDAMDRGLSAEDKEQLDMLQQRSNEREKEILAVVKSVSELHQMFTELNVLVIEQGSIVDRIDYNVDKALVNVKVANQELNKANEYQKKTRTMMCLLVELVVLIILIGIFSYKKTNSSSSSS